jgi:hypothetical protein
MRTNKLRRMVAGVPLLWLFLSGCYEDKTGAYRAVPGDKVDTLAPMPAPKEIEKSAEARPVPAKKDKKKQPSVPIPSEEEMGILYYPNAVPDDLANSALQSLRTPERMVVILETPDAIDTVLEFYRKAMPLAEKSETTLSGRRAVTLELLEPGKPGKSIELRQIEGKTQIELTSIRPTGPPPLP